MSNPSHILLLVEDSPDDAFFVQHALKRAGFNCLTQVVSDGQQAIDYLAGEGLYADRSVYPLPTVIFLDLKLPLLSGFEVLGWKRNQPTLNHLPVIILTGSSENRDKERARELGATAYYVKPPDKAMVQSILESLDPHLIPKETRSAEPGTRIMMRDA